MLLLLFFLSSFFVGAHLFYFIRWSYVIRYYHKINLINNTYHLIILFAWYFKIYLRIHQKISIIVQDIDKSYSVKEANESLYN